MEYIEIVLKDIKIEKINDVLFTFLLFDVKDIVSSYFFDSDKRIESSYHELENIKNHFYTPGICRIYLKKAIIGIEFKNVLIHIACDKKCGDITISFEENQFEMHINKGINGELQNLLTFIINIYKSGEVGDIILGYEPAEDTDMKMVEITKNKMVISNEDYFESSVAKMVYKIAKNLNIY